MFSMFSKQTALERMTVRVKRSPVRFSITHFQRTTELSRAKIVFYQFRATETDVCCPNNGRADGNIRLMMLDVEK